MNTSFSSDLSRAKRDLEYAVDAVKDNARAIWRASCAPQGQCPLDYFYANAANGAAFGKRVQSLRKNQLISTNSLFDGQVVKAYAHYSHVETLAKAEKARLAAKRAAVAAKRDLKAELNLQEGVSLKGVDVGQYKVILAGLEPVRAHVYAARKTELRKEQARQIDVLVANEWNAALAFPDRLHNLRFPNRPMASLPEHFNLFFAYGHTACLREDVVTRIEAEATRFALAYVQGYAAKLALKTGEWAAEQGVDQASPAWNEVHSCTVSSTDLWHNSVAEIVIASRKVRFHTQIIWNRSCLGKVFNQYPTRRV